ncbi:hypothetical protein BX661DRAFT_183359, partial [Kickxella alabastrina]|uniref:uncharacterized protein n=1 Tax=Kickxella alabastrina TaxID=61397 RepID=UPI002220713B
NVRYKNLNKKKRAARQNSNVFAIFDQKQISEFKEAFGIFDHNSDNIVDRDDLREMLSSLGQNVSDSYIDAMSEILSAFEAFDLDGNGLISSADLRDALMQMGDRFTKKDVDIMFKHAPITPDGYLKYREFVQMLKHGE